MAILKVIFPHYDEDANWFMAGDFREVPDHLVDFYLRPDNNLGTKILAIDEDVWLPKAVQPVYPVEAVEAPIELGDGPIMGGEESSFDAPEAPPEDPLVEAPARKKSKK